MAAAPESTVEAAETMSIYKAAPCIKRREGTLYNALRSVAEDAAFVTEVAALWPALPLVANLRCGLWYAPPPATSSPPTATPATGRSPPPASTSTSPSSLVHFAYQLRTGCAKISDVLVSLLVLATLCLNNIDLVAQIDAPIGEVPF
uniref:Rit1 N-terminal domain-containing protein n=1 Tax=Arundo donax TaxID=35708 RepID=A0A0A9F5I1_ARUDO